MVQLNQWFTVDHVRRWDRLKFIIGLGSEFERVTVWEWGIGQDILFIYDEKMWQKPTLLSSAHLCVEPVRHIDFRRCDERKKWTCNLISCILFQLWRSYAFWRLELFERRNKCWYLFHFDFLTLKIIFISDTRVLKIWSTNGLNY
jgi:hypothetical protein